MAGPVLGVNGALALIKQRTDQRVHARAVQGSEIAVQLHMNAPRGGSNVNRYGQRRSGAGEQPAVEDGTLLNALQDPPQPIPGGYAFTVNRKQLEPGTRYVASRPLGAMTVAHLKREVSGGGGS